MPALMPSSGRFPPITILTAGASSPCLAVIAVPIGETAARSTIASQLYNAKEPMTLFELQAWLAHRSPQSTQHYTQITPTHLAQATQRSRFVRVPRNRGRPGPP
jgi:integrase